MLKRSLSLAFVFSLFFAVRPVTAQTPTPSAGPVYIIQSGDTLSGIAERFNVSLNDLMTANNITDPNVVSAGQQLVIPGLEGITGILTTEQINFGDSFRSFERRTQVPADLLVKLNH